MQNIQSLNHQKIEIASLFKKEGKKIDSWKGNYTQHFFEISSRINHSYVLRHFKLQFCQIQCFWLCRIMLLPILTSPSSFSYTFISLLQDMQFAKSKILVGNKLRYMYTYPNLLMWYCYCAQMSADLAIIITLWIVFSCCITMGNWKGIEVLSQHFLSFVLRECAIYIHFI